MRPEKLQDRIYDWFERRYPDHGCWTNPEFHRYQDAPIELRAVVMTNRLEADVSNGGLPQFLWNTFFHWRVVLKDAATGYRLFGATEQERAVAEFAQLFERFEPACRVLVEECLRTQEFALFGRWCDSVRSDLDSDRESLFYDAVPAKRMEWLRANEKLLVGLMRDRA